MTMLISSESSDNILIKQHIDNEDNPHSTAFLNLTDAKFNNIENGHVITYENGNFVNKELNISDTGGSVDNHKNIKVLDLLSDNNGNLEYNGNTIGSNSVNLDEKVKMTPNSLGAKYLNELLDNITIKSINDKLICERISGQEINITELNTLKGMTGNVKQILDTLSNAGMEFKGTVSTKADLLSQAATSGHVYIVMEDETNKGTTVTYIHNGSTWETLGQFGISVRDFKTDPIDLRDEICGTLRKENMDLSDIASEQFVLSEINKLDIEGSNHIHTNKLLLDRFSENNQNELLFDGKGISSKNILFFNQYNNIPKIGEENILYVILKDFTNKNSISIYMYINGAYERVNTSYTEDAIVRNTILKQLTKLNVSAPRTFDIDIENTDDYNVPDVSVLKYKQGMQNKEDIMCNFNESDEDMFEKNEFVEFDGCLSLKTKYRFGSKTEKHGSMYLQKFTIDKSKYKEVISLEAV